MENISCISVMILDSNKPFNMYTTNNLEWSIIALKHNAFHHPNNKFHLITNINYYDDKFKDFQNIVLHKYIDYNNKDIMNEFDKVYIHLSMNPEPFEKNCIKRFFIINEFVKKQNIDRFFHFDLDILFFTDDLDMDFEFFERKGYYLTLLRENCASGCFFDLRKFNSLELFEQCVFASYSKDPLKQPKCFDMEKTKINHKENIEKKLYDVGGVSDMHFWCNIYNTHKDNVFVHMEKSINNIIFQTLLHDNKNTVLEEVSYNQKNIIKVELVNKNCFAFDKNTNNRIRIKYLHFHGAFKELIKNYVSKNI